MSVDKLEKYLSDLDNLAECGFFADKEIKDFVFHHKKMNLSEFISEGREIIRKSLMYKKGN